MAGEEGEHLWDDSGPGHVQIPVQGIPLTMGAFRANYGGLARGGGMEACCPDERYLASQGGHGGMIFNVVISTTCISPHVFPFNNHLSDPLVDQAASFDVVECEVGNDGGQEVIR